MYFADSRLHWRWLRMTKIVRIASLSKLSRSLYERRWYIEDSLRIQIPEGLIGTCLGGRNIRLPVTCGTNAPARVSGILHIGTILIVLVHWVGCFNFLVARDYEFPDGSWVVRAELEDAEVTGFWRQYTWSFFKGMAQVKLKI